jgi:hypothetical protein
LKFNEFIELNLHTKNHHQKMHPVIKEKELTEECRIAWEELKKCHATKRVGRLFRACAAYETALNDCLGREWDQRVERNKEGTEAYRKFAYLRDAKRSNQRM